MKKRKEGFSPISYPFYLLLKLLGLMPMRVMMLIGTLFGALMFHLSSRRKVCRRNLELCFPDKSPAEVEALARENFRAVGRGIVGHFALLTASRNRIKRIVSVTGIEHVAGQITLPTIIFCPHFVGGIVFSAWMTVDYDVGMLHAAQHSAFSEEVLKRVRRRFGGKIFERKSDLLAACRWLKSGKMLSYSPDADLNAEGGVAFVPFFSVEKTATTLAMSRLVEMTHAKVVPAKVELTKAGRYNVTFYPPWDNYPSGDEAKDAERMNQVLEQMILAAPEQYYWLHRRFKTRPEGEPSLY